jgi:DNA repair exonuclease SbcCD ATPase subunit
MTKQRQQAENEYEEAETELKEIESQLLDDLTEQNNTIQLHENNELVIREINSKKLVQSETITRITDLTEKASVPIPSVNGDINDLQNKRTKAQMVYDMALQASKRGKTECPTCGAAPEHQNIKDLEEARQELNEITEIYRVVSDQKRVADSIASAVNYAKEDLKLNKNKLAAVEQDLAALKAKIKTPVSQEELEKAIAIIRAQKKLQDRKTSLLLQINQTGKRIIELKKTEQAYLDKIIKCRDQLKDKQLILSRGETADANLRKRQELVTIGNITKQRHESALKEIQAMLTLREKAEKKQEQKMIKDWQDILTRSRHIVHRDQMPRLIYTSFVSQLISGINNMLDTFYAPFTVTLNEDLTFQANMVNGAVIPASGLSGGQQVLLTVAFWLRAFYAYSSKLGLLSFDEPTDGLDADAKRAVAEMLSELHERFLANNKQLLIVTHDEQLEHISPNTIKL